MSGINVSVLVTFWKFHQLISKTYFSRFLEVAVSLQRFQMADRRGFCFPGKRYNVADVSAALCMSLGLVWFTLADSKVAPNFNATGSNLALFQGIRAMRE